MDSPYLKSPPSPVWSHREPEEGAGSPTIERTRRPPRAGVVIVAGFGNPVAADYADFLGRNSLADSLVVDENTQRLLEPAGRPISIAEFSRSTPDIDGEPSGESSLVLFVGSRLTSDARTLLEDVLAMASRSRCRFIGLVTAFRFHLDHPEIEDVEQFIQSRASGSGARVVVFRPGHVLSLRSPTASFLNCFAPFFPLFPSRLTTTFVAGTELFAAIESERLDERRDPGPDGVWRSSKKMPVSDCPGRALSAGNRAYTILGPNLPWRTMLLRHRSNGLGQSLTTAVSRLLSWLCVGQLLAIVAALLARHFPWWRQWNVQTLFPRSTRELLALCHCYNVDHVKVVGYNNGVDHFGHRHPEKTIVSTVRCRRLMHARPNTLKADCGATVRNALDFLARHDQELYVVPNYSYVCLGTAFFVPIHGSAVDFSTIADTIYRVVLYDPDSNRIISAARDDHAFREHVYNQRSRAVVLRLYLVVKPKAGYFVHRENVVGASADDILVALRDPAATNVEIRQASAASSKVIISRYFKDPGDTSSPALELPRDALGRLWDRLEENPITSYLMHALSRRLAWHTELFFTPAEFAVFWQTHGQLPLRKIQLRYLKRDGLPFSPCHKDDCVSADLFIFRWNRSRFLQYLAKTFTVVRTNPGKHSN